MKVRYIILLSVLVVALALVSIVRNRYAGSTLNRTSKNSERRNESDRRRAPSRISPAQPESSGEAAALATNHGQARPETSSSVASTAGMSDEKRETDLTKRFTELREQLKTHPEMLSSVLDSIRSETDPEMISMLAEAVFKSRDYVKLPIDELRKMAESDPVEARRLAALRMLDAATQINPELMRTVFDIAQKDNSSDVRSYAIGATSFWINKHPEMRDQFFEELLKTRYSSQEGTVRGLAIQTIALQNAPLQGDTLNAMINSLHSESLPDNRALAALALLPKISCGNIGNLQR